MATAAQRAWVEREAPEVWRDQHALVDTYLDIASDYMDLGRLPVARRDRARALWAAHNLLLAAKSASHALAAGPVTGSESDSARFSYGQVQGAAGIPDDWRLTQLGVRLTGLWAAVPQEFPTIF